MTQTRAGWRRLRRGAAVMAAVSSLGVGLAVALPAGAAMAATTVNDPAQYVNTFAGTQQSSIDFGTGGGAANTFPGATAPFGMMQFSPDTVDNQSGGYDYNDNRIRGFSLTHISGAGCGDYENIPFMPTLGSSPVSSYTFSHNNESSAPGFYQVTFDNGLKTELATTTRSGIARFTYPSGQTASLFVDATKAANSASGSVSIGANTITGYEDSGGFCGAGNRYRVYFSATFDHNFTSSNSPKTGQAFVSFNTSNGAPVVARIGMSFVSIANAQANETTEQGSSSFDTIKANTRSAWNNLLSRIAVSGGSDNTTRVFYTALYHVLIDPDVFSDVNGQYIGFDNQIHTVAAGHIQYSNYSGWDVYRLQVQLLALLVPDIASDIAQSIDNQGAQAGYFDRWTLANGNTGVMTGDPLPLIAASIYAFGGTNFNAADLLSRAVAGSTNGVERPGYLEQSQLGYVPYNQNGVWGSAATTLEYGATDAGLAQLAKSLGDTTDYQKFLHTSQDWRGLFNSGNKYIQGRNSDGSFPSFDPASGDQWVEGNGAQYTWMVPWNYAGLVAAMGGNAAVNSRLDNFFTQLNAGPNSAYAYLGDEPSLETPYIYDYTGQPWKTQDVVRRALTTLFTASPADGAGNDDLGEMASTAVWASVGMFPEVPGQAQLVLASPVFPNITISRSNGVSINITAANAAPGNPYVQSLSVNGASSNQTWLPASFVASGGSLDYVLGGSPNTSWGSASNSAPPSFDVGPANPTTGPATSGMAGKCLNGTAGGPLQISTCNGSSAQQVTLASDGTLQMGGNCVDIDHSGTTNGTLVQLFGCNGTAAQQWWPQSNGELLNPATSKCLDDPALSTVDGTQLDIWDCNGGPNQVWNLTGGGTVTPPPPAGGAIVSGVSGSLCVDVSGASDVNGTKVQIWTCNNTAAQTWTVGSNGTLQALGKCLDITGAGTANGTLVELWDCNGGANQVWQSQSNGTLLNPASGRCLDDPGFSTTTGTQLDIWDCNGGGNQHWTLS